MLPVIRFALVAVLALAGSIMLPGQSEAACRGRGIVRAVVSARPGRAVVRGVVTVVSAPARFVANRHGTRLAASYSCSNCSCAEQEVVTADPGPSAKELKKHSEPPAAKLPR